MPDSATPSIRDLMGSSLTMGFNAKSWTLAADRIFDPQYTSGQTVMVQHQGADAAYNVPDGMVVNQDIQAFGSDATVFRHGFSELESDFSTSVEASVGAEGVSADVSFSLAKSSDVKNDNTSNVVLVSWYKTIFSFNRGSAPLTGYTLTENFNNEVAALPADYTATTAPKFFAFFNKWGTHYLFSGFYGGGWRMAATMSDDVFEKRTSEDVKASVSTSFSDGMDSGSAKSSVETSTKQALSLEDKQMHTSWRWYGGDAGDDLATWLNSVDKAPALLNDQTAVVTDSLRPIFKPIWRLVSDNGVKVALRDAYGHYAPAASGGGAELMPPAVSLPLNANTQAPSDGFLQVMISPHVTTGSDDLGQVYAYTDNGGNPSTIVAAASMHEYYASQVTRATLFTPVRAGDFYRLQKGSGSNDKMEDGEGPGRQDGEPKIETSFQPFPLGLGAWKPLKTGTRYTADSAGFVVAAVTSTRDGNRGYILGRQGTGTLGSSPCAGASIHRYQGSASFLYSQSFCMPVPAGNVYQVDFTQTHLDPIATVFWVPLGAAYTMGPLISITPPNSNLANSNGILFGVLDVSAAESLGEMTFEVSADNTFANPSIVGKVAAQQSAGDDKLFPYNSASAVVKKGQYYRATSNQRTGSVVPIVHWVGIKPARAS